MLKNDDCALFIGVNDYSAYDRSVDQPPGKSSLPGSRNDARAFWRVARWLGMRPENLRILTSPPLDPAELEGATAANVGEASESGILEGVGWLASMLRGQPQRAALMTYSGHGAYLDSKGLLLCPSDTQGADLQHAIAFSTLGELLGPAGQNLTTVLDCCHSGAAGASTSGGSDRRIPSLGRALVPDRVTEQDLCFAGRVLAACRPQQVTEQSLFMGQWDGSFSWAVASAMEQWKSVPDGDGRRLEVRYGDLIDRSAVLMKTLAFSGFPLVTGPANVRALAVMQRGEVPAEASWKPDAKPIILQLDPGQLGYRYYTIVDSLSNPVAEVLVPNVTTTIGGNMYYAGTEYWFGVRQTTPSTSLTFAWTDYTLSATPPTLGTLSFTMGRNATWSSSGAPPNQSDDFVSNTVNSAVMWRLAYSGGRWSGSLDWYFVTPQSSIFGGSVSSPQTFTASTTASPGWYTASIPPV
jgi:hypothetical protein